MAKVLGFGMALLFAVFFGIWWNEADTKQSYINATATVAVRTAIAASTIHPRIIVTVCPNQRGTTCIGTPSCTNGAIVNINDDGSIIMPRPPEKEYDCDFIPSQSKVLFWRGA